MEIPVSAWVWRREESCELGELQPEGGGQGREGRRCPLGFRHCKGASQSTITTIPPCLSYPFFVNEKTKAKTSWATCPSHASSEWNIKDVSPTLLPWLCPCSSLQHKLSHKTSGSQFCCSVLHMSFPSPCFHFPWCKKVMLMPVFQDHCSG